MKFNLQKFRRLPIPSQNEIMKLWSSNEIEVSVICLAYNHEKYLEDAIRGFLIQKTNFSFEIIIHDDASSDGTPNIIEFYENRYPKIIKSIRQKKNQYSKLPNSILSIAFKKATGKYFSLCEGDDFWIHPDKLAIQKTIIESEINCSLVVHNAYTLKNETVINVFRKNIKYQIFGVKEIIKYYGQFSPTASYFFKRQLIEVLPHWFDKASVGDILVELYSQKIGTGVYLPEYFSVYRINSVNSWSVSRTSTPEGRAKSFTSLILMFTKILPDFPQFKAEINSRILYCYEIVAYQICGYKFINSLKGEKIMKYNLIRNEVIKIKGFEHDITPLSFPNRLIFFSVFSVIRLSIKKLKAYLSF